MEVGADESIVGDGVEVVHSREVAAFGASWDHLRRSIPLTEG